MKYMKLILAASAFLFVLTPLLLLTCGSRNPAGKSAPDELSVPVQSLVTPVNPARRRSARLAKAQSSEFVLPISDLRSQVGERPEWGLAVSLPPESTSQEKKSTRLYVIRVVDSVSKDPIPHAKVRVEIGNPPKDKRNGYTDSQGFFSFSWELTKTHPKSHVLVQAPGYTTVDDFAPLIEDRLIQLTKAKPQ